MASCDPEWSPVRPSLPWRSAWPRPNIAATVNPMAIGDLGPAAPEVARPCHGGRPSSPSGATREPAAAGPRPSGPAPGRDPLPAPRGHPLGRRALAAVAAVTMPAASQALRATVDP